MGLPRMWRYRGKRLQGACSCDTAPVLIFAWRCCKLYQRSFTDLHTLVTHQELLSLRRLHWCPSFPSVYLAICISVHFWGHKCLYRFIWTPATADWIQHGAWLLSPRYENLLHAGITKTTHWYMPPGEERGRGTTAASGWICIYTDVLQVVLPAFQLSLINWVTALHDPQRETICGTSHISAKQRKSICNK